MVPPKTMYFCKGYDFGEKVDLSKTYWNPKRKMWVATHFSEIILSNHKPKKALKYKECMVISFKIKAQLSLKNAWLPPVFFKDSDNPR